MTFHRLKMSNTVEITEFRQISKKPTVIVPLAHLTKEIYSISYMFIYELFMLLCDLSRQI